MIDDDPTRMADMPDLTDPLTMQQKLEEAAQILSDAGLSFFLAVTGPIKQDEVIKPLSMATMSARPLQSHALLSSVWAGLGQYMITEYSGLVTDDTVDAVFRLGATEASAVMGIALSRSRGAAVMERMQQEAALKAAGQGVYE